MFTSTTSTTTTKNDKQRKQKKTLNLRILFILHSISVNLFYIDSFFFSLNRCLNQIYVCGSGYFFRAFFSIFSLFQCEKKLITKLINAIIMKNERNFFSFLQSIFFGRFHYYLLFIIRISIHTHTHRESISQKIN